MRTVLMADDVKIVHERGAVSLTKQLISTELALVNTPRIENIYAIICAEYGNYSILSLCS